MPAYLLSSLSIRPEAGRTPVLRRLHRFRTSTVDRLSDMATQVGQNATEELRARLRSTYNSPDSTGRTADSAQFRVTADREKGVSLSVYIGAFRQVQYMTNLGGGTFMAGPYRIWAVNASYLDFYWRRIGRRFIGKYVNHPGFREDIPMQVLLKYRDEFTELSMRNIQRGVTEVTAGSKSRAKFRPLRRQYKV